MDMKRVLIAQLTARAKPEMSEQLLHIAAKQAFKS